MTIRCPLCNTQNAVNEADFRGFLLQSVCPRCRANHVFVEDRGGNFPASSQLKNKALKKFYVRIAVIIIVVVTIAIAAVFLGAIHLIKNSASYKMAAELVTTSDEVISAVGGNVEISFFPDAEIKTSGNTGSATYTLTAKSETGSVRVHIRMKRQNGQWDVTSAYFMDTNNKRVDIVKKDLTPTKKEKPNKEKKPAAET